MSVTDPIAVTVEGAPATAEVSWAGLRQYLVSTGWRIDPEITWEETWTKSGCGVFMVSSETRHNIETIARLEHRLPCDVLRDINGPRGTEDA